MSSHDYLEGIHSTNLVEPSVVEEDTLRVGDGEAGRDISGVVALLLADGVRKSARWVDGSPEDVDEGVAGFLTLKTCPNAAKTCKLKILRIQSANGSSHSGNVGVINPGLHDNGLYERKNRVSMTIAIRTR